LLFFLILFLILIKKMKCFYIPNGNQLKNTIANIQKMNPIQFDIHTIRQERQRINNSLVLEGMKMRDLTKNVNRKELDRALNEMEITEEQFLDKCATDIIFAKGLAGRISINASRQGTKDEDFQITTCNITSSKCGTTIENLSATAYRPTKNGDIITNSQVKTLKIQKNDCLKSFDAKISGKKNGWLSAKFVIGRGGHQDNVFEEEHTLCDWVIKYGKENEIYMILIDTDLISQLDELKEKYETHPNIIIGNHVEIQKYFIDTC